MSNSFPNRWKRMLELSLKYLNYVPSVSDPNEDMSGSIWGGHFVTGSNFEPMWSKTLTEYSPQQIDIKYKKKIENELFRRFPTIVTGHEHYNAQRAAQRSTCRHSMRQVVCGRGVHGLKSKTTQNILWLRQCTFTTISRTFAWSNQEENVCKVGILSLFVNKLEFFPKGLMKNGTVWCNWCGGHVLIRYRSTWYNSLCFSSTWRTIKAVHGAALYSLKRKVTPIANFITIITDIPPA